LPDILLEVEAPMPEAIPTPEVSPAGHVLLVDDEPNVLLALRRSLRGHGFEISTAAPHGGRRHRVRHAHARAVRGRCAQGLARAGADALRVLLTGFADIASTLRAVNEGEVFRYLTKPWDDALLLQVLRDGLARKSLERERDALLELTERQNAELRDLNTRLEALVEQRTLALQLNVAELRTLRDRLKADLKQTVRLLELSE
jgi:ActR/RegA family two-component response regulator